MSGNLAEILARPIGVDVLTPLQKYQGLALGNQQVQGASLDNQLKQLQVARTGFAYGAAGIPGVPGAQPSGAASSGGGAPSGGDGSGGYPGQFADSKFGFPAPQFPAAMAFASPDPTKAMSELNETRRKIMHQAVTGAPPQDFPAVMARMFQTGWVSPSMLQDALAHPEARQRIIASTLTPEAYQAAQQAARSAGVAMDENTGKDVVSSTAAAGRGNLAAAESAGHNIGELPLAGAVAGARAGASAAASGQYETTQVVVPDPAHPGQFRSDTILKSALPDFMRANQGARAPSAADLVNPDVTLSPAAFTSRVRGRENAGGNPGAANASGPGGTPTSTALGDGQFLVDTWRSTVAGAQPAWAAGLTDKQLLAARADPAKAAEMTYAYAQQNAPKLQAAGAPVNSLTLGLAHQFGPAGAAALLKADAKAPMASLVGKDVIDANPNLRRATVGQVLGEAFQHYGVNGVDLSAPYQVTPTPAAAPASIAGLPKLTPAGEASLAATKTQLENDQVASDHALAGAQQAAQQQTNLHQLRDLGTEINAGSYGEMRQGVQNYLETFAPDFAKKFVSALTAGKIDPSKAAATQEFVKIALQTASQAEKANNPQGGLGITQVYQSAFPNLETQPSAIRDMSNLFLINQQRTIDHAQGQQAFLDNQRQEFARSGQYRSAQSFDSDFLKTNSPGVYVGAAAALNNKPYEVWSKGLSEDQQKEALGVLWRADPSAAVIIHGKRYTAPAGQ